MLTFQSVALFNFKIGSSKKKPVVLDEKESNKDENTQTPSDQTQPAKKGIKSIIGNTIKKLSPKDKDKKASENKETNDTSKQPP